LYQAYEKKIIIGAIAVLSIVLAYHNYTAGEYFTLYGKINVDVLPVKENYPIVYNDAQIGFVNRLFTIKNMYSSWK
jgi:hypothetical protein